MGTENDATPVNWSGSKVSPMPLIAPPPLGRETLGGAIFVLFFILINERCRLVLLLLRSKRIYVHRILAAVTEHKLNRAKWKRPAENLIGLLIERALEP